MLPFFGHKSLISFEMLTCMFVLGYRRGDNVNGTLVESFCFRISSGPSELKSHGWPKTFHSITEKNICHVGTVYHCYFVLPCPPGKPSLALHFFQLFSSINNGVCLQMFIVELICSMCWRLLRFHCISLWKPILFSKWTLLNAYFKPKWMWSRQS